MSDFRIAWLFPDTLFLHGERGNLLALARFARLAGFEPEIIKVDFDTEDFDPFDFNVIFCGPGEIVSFQSVIEYLIPFKEELASFVESGRPLIVTGTSVGIFGNKVIRKRDSFMDADDFKGLGIVDLTYSENDEVYGDDIYFECEYGGRRMELIGNQIQMGDLDIGKEPPFGVLKYGYGNTGKDRNEGLRRCNSIFTNTLGPMLTCNPWLTGTVIKVAAENSELPVKDITFDDELERKSFETKRGFISKKVSRLTNCPRPE